MTIIEDGIIAGNLYDKYASANPVVRYMMKGFHDCLDALVSKTGVNEIHEVGCGEGNLSIALAKQKKKVVASDFSGKIIEIASENARRAKVDIKFKIASIYDLATSDSAKLILCSEVLEHLHNPVNALAILEQLADPFLIISVPREPLWRIMNLVRFKYIFELGNTPGHIQHWSKTALLKLLSSYFDIIDVLTPTPWIMVLCRSKKLLKAAI
ncbi:MAG: class I SAM-dependent methyltransferase [Pseudomonadota bacterium]